MHAGTTLALVVAVAAVGVIGYTYYSDMKSKEEENRRILANQIASQQNSPRNIPDASGINLGVVNIPSPARTVSSVYFDPVNMFGYSQAIQDRYMIPTEQNFGF